MISAFFALTLPLALAAATPVPRMIFGQNLEHSRAAFTGGLSAEVLRNRKFAGHPSIDGVAMGWQPFGTRAAYDHLSEFSWTTRGGAFTRHASKSRMYRQNEIGAQLVTALDPKGFAGVSQGPLALRGGMGYVFVANLRSHVEGDRVPWRVRIRGTSGNVLVEKTMATGKPWQRMEFDFDVESEADAVLEIGIEGIGSGVVGTASLLPKDNFRGMRADVIELLQEIGTTIVRWPGGNWAGDYRWRDGLLPRDERAPLQSHNEIENHPWTWGYDDNDFSTDDILALADRLKAMPYFTINAMWDSPADTADWVRHCGSRVRHWSLGNEFGFPHMEGSSTPEAYRKLVSPHATAMLSADPGITLVTSGNYPGQADKWLAGAGIPLGEVAKIVSCHQYTNPKELDYSTRERADESVRKTLAAAAEVFERLRTFHGKLPPDFGISFDEWNFWHAWYRDDGGTQGVYALYFLHRLMSEWESLNLKYVCFFQAVNEGAIRVEPRSARLTAIGHALRLAKRHVGGVPVGRMPDEVFASDFPNGIRQVSLFNPSALVSRRFEVPAGACSEVVQEEIAVVDDPFPGARYHSGHSESVLSGGNLIVELSPLGLAGFTLK